jgi:hypothetical protein
MAVVVVVQRRGESFTRKLRLVCQEAGLAPPKLIFTKHQDKVEVAEVVVVVEVGGGGG